MEGVSTLSICGFPRALRYLLILKLLVCACFKEFCLLRDNPCIGPQECDEVVFEICFESVGVKFVCLSKYLGTIYLLEKSLFVFL